MSRRWSGRVSSTPMCSRHQRRRSPKLPRAMRASSAARRGRSKACRSASRICSAPRACAPRQARPSWAISRPTMNRPSPAICGETVRSCSASSIATNSPWVRQRDLGLRSGRLALAAAQLGWRARARDHRQGDGRARRARRAPGARGLLGRLGGRRRGAALPRRHRDRYGRLDPPAGRLHRHGGHQADLWPLLALRHRRFRLLARSGRTDRAHGARLRYPASRDGGARSARTRPRRKFRFPISRRRCRVASKG